MPPAGSPSRECRSAPTSPPAPSSGSPANPQRSEMSEISEEPKPSGTAGAPSTTPVDPSELATMPAVEEAFKEIEVDEPRVGIIMGSKNDKPKMEPAGKALEELGIRYYVQVMSDHRDPEM